MEEKWLWSEDQGSCSIFKSDIEIACVCLGSNHKIWHAISTQTPNPNPQTSSILIARPAPVSGLEASFDWIFFFLLTTPKGSCFLRENQFLLMSRTPSGSLLLICPALFRPKNTELVTRQAGAWITWNWFMHRDSRSSHILDKTNQVVFLWKPQIHAQTSLLTCSYSHWVKAKGRRLIRNTTLAHRIKQMLSIMYSQQNSLQRKDNKETTWSLQIKRLMYHSRWDFSVLIEPALHFFPCFLWLNIFLYCNFVA